MYELPLVERVLLLDQETRQVDFCRNGSRPYRSAQGESEVRTIGSIAAAAIPVRCLILWFKPDTFDKTLMKEEFTTLAAIVVFPDPGAPEIPTRYREVGASLRNVNAE